MTLADLLAEQNLSVALVVDDAYDEIPRADDLATDQEAWATFFADLSDEDKRIVTDKFPEFVDTETSNLTRLDTFVAVLWGLRGQLSDPVWMTLFERYIGSGEADRAYLSRLEQELAALNISVVRGTRQVSDIGRTEPLIFADLFLGSAQTDTDMGTSITRLKRLLAGRMNEPPLVVLMSRSQKLSAKRSEFRDGAGILGSMFRVHAKQELLEGDTLTQTLERLARHRPDALRVAAFINAWDAGLESARKRFLAAMRRLDLADYGQIQGLLLEFEGQPLGSYALDIFDRVLEHEIEGDASTISAAEKLNEIDPEGYPPPYIGGSPDLQELLLRSIYQHTERLRVTNTECDAPVAFGDILVRCDSRTVAPTDARDDVLVVLTPACDLVRSGAKRVMMMAGALEELAPKSWIYKSTPLRTPVIVLEDERRMWIRWDPKDVQMMSPAQLRSMLKTDDATHKRLVRLRESHALELQQQLLSSLGRVGLVAQMPASFRVVVEVCFWGKDEVLHAHRIPLLDEEGGVCLAGRDRDSSAVSRLRLSEGACDAVRLAIMGLDENEVHPSARATLVRLKGSSSFAATLERGLTCSNGEKTSFMPIVTPGAGLDAQSKPLQDQVGLIVRNPPVRVLKGNDVKSGGFVVLLFDLSGPLVNP